MTTLGKDSVDKTAATGDFAGKLRLEIMTLKIAKGKAFSLGAKGDLGEIYGLKVTDEKWPWKMDYAYEPNAKTAIGNISAAKLFKDPDFGGGSGSGGGAEVTAVTECLQCYYIAAAYALGRTLKDIDVSIDPKTKKSKLFDYEKKCDTDRTLAYCLKNNPEAWGADVYMKIANAIYNSDACKGFIGKKVRLHRGSKFMDAVYDKKKKCKEHDKAAKSKNGSADRNLAPASFSNDKWNPGDVWMTSLTGNVPFPDAIYAINNNGGGKGQDACDWPTLKGVVRTAAIKGVTIGISLKKIGKKATVKEFNTDSDDFNGVTWNGFKFGKKGDFFSSSDMYVNMGNAEVQFRSFNTTKAWQGEIKGLAAAGGKVGGGSVQYYIEKHIKGASIGSSAGHGWKEGNIKSVDKAYKLYEKYNEMQKGTTGKVETLEKDEFLKKWNASSAGFKFSKGMNLLFLEAVDGGKKKGIKSFAGDLFRYASSSTDQSSYFIKVS
jgi:hypothetical protein